MNEIPVNVGSDWYVAQNESMYSWQLCASGPVEPITLATARVKVIPSYNTK